MGTMYYKTSSGSLVPITGTLINTVTEGTNAALAPNGTFFYDSTDAGYPAAITQSQADGWYANRIATTTDTGVPRFNGTTGLIQNSGVTIDGSNKLSIPSGSSAGIQFGTAQRVMSGTGTPTFNAPQGSVFFQTDATTYGHLKWIQKGVGTTNSWSPDFEGRIPYAISTVYNNAPASTSGWIDIPTTISSSRAITTPSAGRYNVTYSGLYRFTAMIQTRANTTTRLLLAAKADGDPSASNDDWIFDSPSNSHSTIKTITTSVLLNVSAYAAFKYYSDVLSQSVYLKTTIEYVGIA